ncbi:MAG: hypothetical protein KKB20_11420 [Proteobacteria bacterium]|nr:hypothetical protein [Pseudomonadota bacterium]
MDIKTLVFCNVMIPLFLSLALVFFRAYQKTYPGFGLWTAATLIIAGGYVLPLFRLNMPLWVSIIAMNGLFAWGGVVRLAGIWFAAAGLCIGALAFFYFVLDLIAVRTVIINVFFFLATVRASLEIIRFAPAESRPLYLATGGLCLLAGLFILVRAGAAIMSAPFFVLDSGSVFVVYFLMMIIFELTWGVAFLMMNSQRLESEPRNSERSMAAMVGELEKTLAEVRTLRGFIPICSNRKNIRDDAGYWQRIDPYVSEHSDARFSHGICPECARKLYPDVAAGLLDEPDD